MSARDQRAHGVTPGLSEDYAARTAERQAAFLVPRLRPGIDLLDVGCGPGTITLGLARAVAPGSATGIDHDAAHVASARALAAERGISNASFLVSDALSLPFEDETFDAAFENNVFIHISEDVVRAAEEVLRVLKPGGLFAARDAGAEAVVWGRANDSTRRLDELMIAWQRSRQRRHPGQTAARDPARGGVRRDSQERLGRHEGRPRGDALARGDGDLPARRPVGRGHRRERVGRGGRGRAPEGGHKGVGGAPGRVLRQRPRGGGGSEATLLERRRDHRRRP